MAVTLDFQKLPAKGNVTVLWAPTNAFANWRSATITELNALLNMSRAISWNDFDFATDASNTVDDPSIADTGNVQDRGASQYGGSISFYQPGSWGDVSNRYSVVSDAVGTPGVQGYIIVRLDGNKPSGQAFASGDYYHIYQVQGDAQTNVFTGEDAFRYTINFLQKGNLGLYTIARSGAATVVVTPTSPTVAVGAVTRLSATVNGREYTNGVRWTSADTSRVTVTTAGVVRRIASGTVVVTATFAQTGATATATIS